MDLSPANIAQGERVRRPGVVWAGSVILLIAAFAWVPAIGTIGQLIKWYQYVPTFWVIRDLRSSSPTAADKAMEELIRRGKVNSLTSSQRRAISDLGLQHQATKLTSGVTSLLVEATGRELVAGRLTEQQRATFGRQSIQLALRVRPRVRSGDPVPYQVDALCRVNGGTLWVRSDLRRVEIDGKLVQEFNNSGGGGRGGMAGLGAGGSHGNQVRFEVPGEHELAVTCDTMLGQDEFGVLTNEPLFRQQLRMTAKFQVLASGTPDGFQVIDDPSLLEKIRSCVLPQHLYWQAGGVNLRGEIEVKQAPINLSFDLLLRVAGREIKLGSRIKAVKGGGSTHVISEQIPNLPDPKPAMVDIILRTNENAARATVDQFDVWKGEVEFLNVAVDSEREPK